MKFKQPTKVKWSDLPEPSNGGHTSGTAKGTSHNHLRDTHKLPFEPPQGHPQTAIRAIS